MKRTTTRDEPEPWRCARCLRQRPYAARHGERPTCNRCAEELRAKGLKWCPGCVKPLPLARFARVGVLDEHRRGTCRSCYAPRRREVAAASMRKWRALNKERIRAYAQAYRARDRQQTTQRRREAYYRATLRALRGATS
jgi:hypothetical protein